MGNNWLILIMVAGCGTALVALLLVGVEHTRSNALRTELDATQAETSQKIADIETRLDTLIGGDGGPAQGFS